MAHNKETLEAVKHKALFDDCGYDFSFDPEFSDIDNLT